MSTIGQAAKQLIDHNRRGGTSQALAQAALRCSHDQPVVIVVATSNALGCMTSYLGQPLKDNISVVTLGQLPLRSPGPPGVVLFDTDAVWGLTPSGTDPSLDQDFEQVSFLTDRPEKGVRVTIEFADPDVPDAVLEFDEMHLEQNRPVATRYEGDKVAELIPSRTTTTVITGTKLTAEG